MTREISKQVANHFKDDFADLLKTLPEGLHFRGIADDKAKVVAQAFAIGILTALTTAIKDTPAKDFASRLVDVTEALEGDHESDLKFLEDKAINSIKVGPTVFNPAGNLYVDEYLSGGTKLFVGTSKTEGLTASVYLEGETEKLPSNEVYLKDYSENKGMVEALVAAGVVRLTDKSLSSEYVHFQHAEIIGDAFKLVSHMVARKAC